MAAAAAVTSLHAATPGRMPGVADLCSLTLVRERCRNLLDAIDSGASAHFTLDRARLEDAATRTAAITRERYPDLRVPYHSRWRHFEAGGVSRRPLVDRALAHLPPGPVRSTTCCATDARTR